MSSAPIDWSKYQKLADELVSRPEEECLRTAISRGYYSILHQCRDRLLNNGHTITQGGTHKQVWDKFGKSPDPACKKLAIWGRTLKGKREMADYDTQFPGKIEIDAPLLVAETAKFAADLAKIPAHLPTYP
jgi:uncharacterized protein (UPF0332 family)